MLNCQMLFLKKGRNTSYTSHTKTSLPFILSRFVAYTISRSERQQGWNRSFYKNDKKEESKRCKPGNKQISSHFRNSYFPFARNSWTLRYSVQPALTFLACDWTPSVGHFTLCGCFCSSGQKKSSPAQMFKELYFKEIKFCRD